jgi:hypothetical protein
MKCSLLVFCMVITMTAVYTRSQTPHQNTELEVAGIKLHLGMTKAEVIQKLAGKQFQKMNEDNWQVGPENSGGPLIQFTNGKLNFTERYWATPENDTGEALFGAVNSLNRDGFRSCEVTAGVNSSPDSTAHNVWISCGEKSVVVSRLTMYGKTYTMVYEQLGYQHDIGK